jgi:ABC-type transport system involved in multi-copper enzyme maturation permease subunit
MTVNPLFNRFRLRFAPRNWSNSAEAWQERLGVLLLIIGGIAGYTLSNFISLPGLFLAVAVWIATLFVLLRHGWIRFLGPLFLFDLFQATRRSRYFLLRVYVYFILLLLFSVVVTWSARTRSNYRIDSFRADRAALIAENYFYIFLLAHAAFSALITPAYVAPALTEEKERNTLEALMATDLSSREIVLSKLAVRMANLLLMLLTGLPIVTAFLILGGADPSVLLVGYLAILFFTGTLSCLAINNSVRARRTRDSIVTTYIEMGAYLVLTTVLFFALRRWIPTTRFAFSIGPWLVDTWPVVETLLSGNPLLVFARGTEFAVFGGRSTQFFITMMVEFISFHLVVSGFLTLMAIVRFRRTFQLQAYGRLLKDTKSWGRWRPKLGDSPLFWKEVFTDAPATRGRLRWILMRLLVAASFLPLVVIESNRSLYFQTQDYVFRNYFDFTTMMGSAVLCLLLVRVVIHSALVYSRERDQQTMDSLLTCPVSAEAIAGSKWLGSMLSVRKLWLWPALIWSIGLYANVISIHTVLVLVFFWLIYAGVGSLFGQLCSLVCRTGLRAIMFTLVVLGIMTSGVLMIPLQYFVVNVAVESTPGIRTWILRGQLATSPPIVFGRMIPGRFTEATQYKLTSWEWPTTLVGTLVWLVTGVVLWLLICRRIRVPASREANERLQQKLNQPPAEQEPRVLIPCPTE